MKQEIKPATGRLGVLVVGVGGAVATTMIVGTPLPKMSLASLLTSSTVMAFTSGMLSLCWFSRSGLAWESFSRDVPVSYTHLQFIFQFPDRFGQAGLGYEKPFGSLIDGTAVDDADDIF